MWHGINYTFPTLSVISEYDDSLVRYSQLYFRYFLIGNENIYPKRQRLEISINLMDNEPDYRIFQKQKTPRLSVAS
ncbi:hypothetical protein OZ705_003490, partial [Yersinia enterocolitica]